MRVFRLAMCLAALSGALCGGSAGAGSLGAPSLSPASITAGTPATVKFTVTITDPNYVAGSANVQRLKADGTVQGVAGLLHDDGRAGDATAGDGLYTLDLPLNETAAGTLRFQVSAAYRNEPRRTVAGPLAVTVDAASAAPRLDGAAFSIGSTAAGTAVTGLVTVAVEAAAPPATLVLQKIDANGAVIATAGTLHDDGMEGDATAGDKLYSLGATVLENTPGTLRYRVAGTFPGYAQAVYSNVVSVAITGTATSVEITSPAGGAYLNTPVVTVSGKVGDPGARVTLNGVSAVLSGTDFNASVPLNEGPNTVTAVATNSGGSTTTSSILVTLDTTAPKVEIYSPAAGGTTGAASVTVSGMVNDIVVGTVNPQQATVTVNGIAAEVLNRTFVAKDVPLAAGSNTVQATATDRAGNRATTSATVTRLAAGGLQLVSGNDQRGAAGGVLAAPLVVLLTDAQGAPVANKPVVFRVVGLDGTLSANLLPGSAALSALAVNSDSEGKARAFYRLGSRAGGGNLVEASSAAAQATVDLVATGTPGGARLMVVDSGNNQTGVVGQALPFPFIAIVTDDHNNRLASIPVTFTVKDGGGGFGTARATTWQTASDSDGRVAATLFLGPEQGVNNNVVEANFNGGSGFAAAFTANGLVPGPAAQTRISGVVLDNSNQPIPGVTMRLLQITQGNRSNIPQEMAPAVRTDAQGQFTMTGVPVGVFKLMADGGTATRDGVWPTLDFDMVTVSGQNNTLGMPIFLPALNPNNRLCVSETTGGTLTLPEVPGFALQIAPGSATFPGGSRSGCVHVTPVNMDKVPMAPGFGQQPRFVVTIQPVGTHFSPAARMTIPNVDGLAPRAVTEMYSYDHDLASFVAIGSATVSADGATITSDPGAGVIKAGWHCGGDPNTSGSAGSCPTCKKCEGASCIADDSQRPPDLCKECKNGTPVDKYDSSWRDDATVGASANLPDGLKDALENGLNRIPGVNITLSEVKLSASGKAKDCCDPATGNSVPLGKKEGKAAIELGVSLRRVQIWPLPPTMIDRRWDVTVFGEIIEVRILFLAGVFITSDLKFAGEGGVRLDACGTENCAFGGLGAEVNAALSAEVAAQGCFDSTATQQYCSPTIDAKITPVALSIQGSLGYNQASCTAGMSGFAKVAGVKAALEFKLPLLPTLSVEYEMFGGFCIIGNCG
ncbi:carboxypeptidase family protein [Pseudoduganella lurida]|uniref:Carboxypeptidase family protein n=1 Tax=Pseudoduganella lurida TaxID=1036180 RepID=A0A562RMS2_9BURK|nr:choice-of-anchor X domain-containing protein [Pseudoduganella lurida]TWI69730.1 carboxypeptidase family protein [Pseudoduganella lurida]